MALKINRNLQRILKIIGWVLLIGLVISMIKILAWEHNYYDTKSAETRSKADVTITQLGDALNPSEEEPDIEAHQVEASKPRYLIIKRLDIKARVKESTINSEVLAVPQNIYDIMWSAGSGKPGQGGIVLMTGLTRGLSKKGLLSDIDSLEKGNEIVIELGNGDKIKYKVAEVRIVDYYDAENELPSIQRKIGEMETLSILASKDDENSTDYQSIVIVRATKE